jgi:hypothetical protein
MMRRSVLKWLLSRTLLRNSPNPIWESGLDKRISVGSIWIIDQYRSINTFEDEQTSGARANDFKLRNKLANVFK